MSNKFHSDCAYIKKYLDEHYPLTDEIKKQLESYSQPAGTYSIDSQNYNKYYFDSEENNKYSYIDGELESRSLYSMLLPFMFDFKKKDFGYFQLEFLKHQNMLYIPSYNDIIIRKWLWEDKGRIEGECIYYSLQNVLQALKRGRIDLGEIVRIFRKIMIYIKKQLPNNSIDQTDYKLLLSCYSI
jgi:hypothetical protein